MPKKLPSQVLEEKIKKAEDAKDKNQKTQIEKAQAHEQLLLAAFNEVAGSEAGRVVFRELAKLCNFRRSKVLANAQTFTVDPTSTMFNCAMENVYLNMTKRVRAEYLVKIEYSLLKQKEG